MTLALRVAVSAALAALLVSTARAQIGVGNQDRVVFYSDPLVYAPGFGSMIESFVRAKYPASNARFWRISVPDPGYAKIEVAAQRFDELVAPLRPTIVVLCWGLGDGELKAHDPSRVAKTADAFEKLLNRCLNSGARVYVLTPSLPTVSKKNILASSNYDETVGKIGEALAAISERKGAVVLDWYGALAKLQREGHDADLTERDGLAPSPLSKSVAANLILRAWKLEPIEVAIDVDWTAETVSSTHGTVDLSRVSDDAMRLTLRDFPMPFHTGMNRSSFREEFACAKFCRIILKIDNLPDGRVRLGESGSRVKPLEITAEQLRQGYNMAIDSPLVAAAAVTELAELITSKNRAFGAVVRFRRDLLANPPEPEYVESYKTHLLSREQYHEGCVQIIQRTGRTVDMSMDLVLVGKGSGQ